LKQRERHGSAREKKKENGLKSQPKRKEKKKKKKRSGRVPEEKERKWGQERE
jgi:hypothetical protein